MPTARCCSCAGYAFFQENSYKQFYILYQFFFFKVILIIKIYILNYSLIYFIHSQQKKKNKYKESQMNNPHH